MILTHRPGGRKPLVPLYPPIYTPPPDEVRGLVQTLSVVPTDMASRVALSEWLHVHPEHVRPFYAIKYVPNDFGESLQEVYRRYPAATKSFFADRPSAPMMFGATTLFDRKVFAVECRDMDWLKRCARLHNLTDAPMVLTLSPTPRVSWFSQVPAG